MVLLLLLVAVGSGAISTAPLRVVVVVCGGVACRGAVGRVEIVASLLLQLVDDHDNLAASCLLIASFLVEVVVLVRGVVAAVPIGGAGGVMMMRVLLMR